MVTTAPELAVGQVLDGRYRIVGRIARGGMATVYEALDTRLHREVAVKVMHAALAGDDDFVQRFIREARSAARLSHPNVVAVFDQGSQVDDRTGEDCVYLVMELVRGRTLRQVLRDRGALPPADALAVLEPVLAALRAAHDAGIVHRDVKPENVLLADDGRVEVADFGLARAVNSAGGHGAGDTSTRGVLLGTVSYLAPEQVVDGSADARTDVYSAGIMLFEMLTGSKPHDGDSPIAVAYKHVNDDVPRPSARRPGIPPAVDRLVRRATDRRPEQRFADGREFLAAVRTTRDLLRQHPDRAPGGPNTRPAPRRGPVSGNTTVIGLAPGSIPPTPAMSGTSAPAGQQGSRIDPGNARRGGGSETGGLRAARTGSSPTGGGSPTGSLARDALACAGPPARPDGRRSAPPGPTSLPPPTSRAPASSWAPASWDAGPPSAPAQQQAPGQPARPTAADVAAARRHTLARRRRRRGIAAVLGVVLLAIVLAAGAWYIGDGRFAAVPRLSGLPVVQAEQAASAAGLRLSVANQRWDDAIPSGYVISASNPAQERLPRGSTVGVVVSRGAERHVLPRVVGLSETAAETAIRRQSLAIGPIRAIWDAAHPAGQVVDSDPAAGKALKGATPVILTVSRGPEPVTVPDVLGQPGAQAAAAVRAAGVGVKLVQAASDTVADGQVATQTPAAGDVSPDTVVTLVVSTGPAPVVVPSVIGSSTAAATARLEALGLKVEVRHALIYVGLNRVYSVSAWGGSTVPRGSTIVLTVI